jgi:hypothetical protein
MGDKLTAMQAELPSLSSQSRHITVEGAYHEGLLSQRGHALLVTESILRVVEAVRSGRPLSPDRTSSDQETDRADARGS